MKFIQSLFFLTTLSLLAISNLKASFITEHSPHSDRQNSDYSTGTSLESYSFDSDDYTNESLFFIEKPGKNWSTFYFKTPTVIQAIINIENESELILLGPIDYVIGNKSLPTSPLLLEDFIICNGPARELTTHQYKRLLERYTDVDSSSSKHHDNKTLSRKEYLRTSPKKTVEYKTSYYTLTPGT